MRIGLGITQPFDVPRPIEDILARLQQAEDDGFASAWTPSLPGVASVEALVLLAACARATSRIGLGTYVVPTYPRHPVVLAQQALSVQLFSGNRLTLGIGLSHKPVIENALGLDFSKPIRHMREYLAVLTPLLRGEPVRFSGQDYRVNMNSNLPGTVAPPVLVAALQPQMLRLAGELADGTAFGMGGPKYIETVAVPAITKAARSAGRPSPRFAVMYPIAVTGNAEAGMAAGKAAYRGYERMPSYRTLLDFEGMQEAGELTIAGDEAEVRRRLSRLAAIGVTDFIASRVVVPEDPESYDRTYALLADISRRGLA